MDKKRSISLNPSSFEISAEVFNYNYKLYFFLKKLNSGNGVTDSISQEMQRIIIKYLINDSVLNDSLIPDKIKMIKSLLNSTYENIKSYTRKNTLNEVLRQIDNYDDLIIFYFSLQLIFVKDLFLIESKIVEFDKFIRNDIHPLSIKYDDLGIERPYKRRTKSALLCYLFFEKLHNKNNNFLLNDSQNYVLNLINSYHYINSLGVSINQIFMLMFSESVNQAITSNSGSDYESRVLEVLISQGIEKDAISEQVHDDQHLSTEYDFIFSLNNKKYGISAKKTLRERYKQFLDTLNTNIDVMIQVTLGFDLTESIANNIINHNVYLFVSEEIYSERLYCQTSDKIFSAKDLTKETLLSLV